MTRLEKLTNICMVVVSIAIAVDVATRVWTRSAAVAAPRNVPVEYKSGDRLTDVRGLRLPTDRSSLVLIVRSTCAYCTKSLPFYQRVADEIKASGGATQVNAVCTEAADTCTAYLNDAGVEVNQVVSAAPGSLKIAGTPTLLLVRSDGRVARVWRGMLDQNGEREVLDAVLGKIKS
jgi:hypothetical protein